MQIISLDREVPIFKVYGHLTYLCDLVLLQFLEFKPHIVSFVQVRGSIPVYWSQSGLKYRPPPRLDKGRV